MDLLSHPLIVKYFGGGLSCEMAERILAAMQEPIKKGEKIITFWNMPPEEGINRFAIETAPHDLKTFHPNTLRLPSRFQPSAERKECYCEEIEQARKLSASLCLNWGMPRCRAHDPAPSSKEKKCKGNHEFHEYCEEHDMCTNNCIEKMPSPLGLSEEVEEIVNKVMDSVYDLPLGTTLNEAKGFMKKKLTEALAQKGKK